MYGGYGRGPTNVLTVPITLWNELHCELHALRSCRDGWVAYAPEAVQCAPQVASNRRYVVQRSPSMRTGTPQHQSAKARTNSVRLQREAGTQTESAPQEADPDYSQSATPRWRQPAAALHGSGCSILSPTPPTVNGISSEQSSFCLSPQPPPPLRTTSASQEPALSLRAEPEHCAEMLLAEAEERLSMERLAHAELCEVLRLELQGAREAAAAGQQALDATAQALRAEQKAREDAEAAHFQECLDIAGASAVAEEALDTAGERQELIDAAEEALRVERAARDAADAVLIAELQGVADAAAATQRVCAEACALGEDMARKKSPNTWEGWWPRWPSTGRVAAGPLCGIQLLQKALARAEQSAAMSKQCWQRTRAAAAESDFQREQRLARLRPHVLTAEERAQIRAAEGRLLTSEVAVHCLAAWSPRWWAPVCQRAAHSVMGVHHVWAVSLRCEDAAIRTIRSRGADCARHLIRYGPELGHVWSAMKEIEQLHVEYTDASRHWPRHVAQNYFFLLRRINAWMHLIEHVDITLNDMQVLAKRCAERAERTMEVLCEVVDGAQLHDST